MSGVIGGYSYTFEPSIPNGFEEYRVRVDSTDGCYRGIAVTRAFIEARKLNLYMGGSDAGEPNCPAFTPVYRTYGVVPRGTYTMVVYSCVSNPPPGAPQCIVHETRQLLVGGGDPVDVPAIGLTGVAALILGALLLARRRAFGR